MKRGPRPRSEKIADMRIAIRHLNDAFSLNDVALAASPAVVSRAARDYRNRACSRGLALAAIMHDVLKEIARDFPAGSPIPMLAACLEQGATQRDAAERLGMSEEHLSRHWKPRLLRLLLDRLETMNREVAELSRIAG